jgi:hypothetical protein
MQKFLILSQVLYIEELSIELEYIGIWSEWESFKLGPTADNFNLCKRTPGAMRSKDHMWSYNQCPIKMPL